MFLDIVSDLENRYSGELSGIFDVYEDITSQLQESRAGVQKMLKSNNDMTKKLLSIREDLTEIQSEIF